MKSVLALVVLAVAALAQAAGNLTVQTPAQLVTCQPALISFSGGTPPYFLSVLPGGQTSAAALESFPTQNGSSYTWPKVNIAGGTSITIQIRDSAGVINYSSPVTVQAGPDQSCVGSNSTAGSSPAAGGSPTQSPASGGSTSASSGATTTSSSSTPATSPSTSPTHSGASGLTAAGYAFVGVAGLIGAALL